MNRKPRILVVGSFVMDLAATAGRVPDFGETVIGTHFRTAPGGKGANQAVQAARLGAETFMAGCVGDDSFGREMLAALNASGVDTSHVKISHEHPSGVGHIQIQSGDSGVQNRIIVVPGANYDLHPSDLAWLEGEIGGFDMLVMQLEIPMETIEYAARIAHDAGVPVMMNPAPAAPLSDELLSCLTFLCPNETEAAILSGVPADAEGRLPEEDLQAICATLMGKGVPNLIITLGSNGAVLCNAEGLVRVPCVKMRDVADPTAAGDSFVGAFCAGFAAGLPAEKAMQLAVHAAALTVCGFGAIPSLPDLDRVRELMRERRFDESLTDILK